MARFAVICYILFGLSNLRVTVCPPPLSPPSIEEKRTERRGKKRRKSKRERENKKGERVKSRLECLDPGEVTTPGRRGRKRGEDGALRLHSSANRGIFVRFLFENKTLPTTLDARKGARGREGTTKGCAP